MKVNSKQEDEKKLSCSGGDLCFAKAKDLLSKRRLTSSAGKYIQYIELSIRVKSIRVKRKIIRHQKYAK